MKKWRQIAEVRQTNFKISDSRRAVSNKPTDLSVPKAISHLGSYCVKLTPRITKQDVVDKLQNVKDTSSFYSAVSTLRSLITLNPTFGLINDRTDLFHRFVESSLACNDLDVAWNTLLLFREQGMQMIRPHAYAMLNIIRQDVENRVEREGRNLEIIDSLYARLRSFVAMSEEDGILMDYMLWTRYLVIMLQLVGLFDRQLVYKEKWVSSQVRKRDGLFVDYVVTDERLIDYDHAVSETYRFLDEILKKIKLNIPTRPSFAFMFRLAELLFSCDDFRRMHSVLEDMKQMQMFYPDTLTSKLLQLAAAFNHPKMPQLFSNWRIYHENASLNSFDFFRLLAYYSRSGGGLPCPKCGDPSNHRDASLDYWKNVAKEEWKQCEYLKLARVAKGAYNDLPDIPQNADWSQKAFDIFEWAQESHVHFGSGEWRLFLLCCTNSPQWKKALETLHSGLPMNKWDDILMGTVFRMLRFNAPRELMPMCRQIKASGKFLHTLAVNEALLGVFSIDDQDTRMEELGALMKLMRTIGSPPYLYTIRSLNRILSQRLEEKTASELEISIVNDISMWGRRLGNRTKESFWELVRSQANRSTTHY